MRSAHTMRIGFLEGYFDRSDLEDWITAQADALDPIPSPLLDLVPLHAHDDSAVDALLRTLAGAIAPDVEARLRIDVVCEACRHGRISLAVAAHRLELIACHSIDWLPSDLGSAAAALSDGLLLASSGTHGTVADAERAVVEFVAQYGRPLVL